MGKKVILDTNILIGLWTNQSATFRKFPELIESEMCINIFTYVEMMAATPTKHKDATKKFLEGFKFVPYTLNTTSWAKLISYKIVTPSAQFMDLLIYANAKGEESTVITENTKHFDKFKEVKKGTKKKRKSK